MSVTLAPPEQAEMATTPPRRHRRFSVAEYEKMIALDILTEQDRCELIRGQILEKPWDTSSDYPPHFKFSVAAYERMVESGILTEQDRCELIRGEVLEKMTIGTRRAACVKRLNHLLSHLVGLRAIVGVQDPVETIQSCPEPDLTLLKPQADYYAETLPRPENMMLVIEVADSSLHYDRIEKLSLYAESGVKEYWIANVIDQCLEVYRGPRPDGTYAERRTVTLGEQTDIVALPGVTVVVDQIFKPDR